MKWYRKAEEHGDKEAYGYIGLFYAKGLGVKKDLNHAVQYYITGAQKGDAKSQVLLANAYSKAKGIGYDSEKALYWYKQAGKNGSIEAMKELGDIYETGRLGVKKDERESRYWKDIAEKAEKKQK